MADEDRRKKRLRVGAVLALLLAVLVVADLWVRQHTFDELVTSAASVVFRLEHAEDAANTTFQNELERGRSAQDAYRAAIPATGAHRSEAVARLQEVKDEWVLPWHWSLARAKERFVDYAETREEQLGTAEFNEARELKVQADASHSVAEAAFRDAAPTVDVEFRRSDLGVPLPHFSLHDESGILMVFYPRESGVLEFLETLEDGFEE